MRCNEWYSAIIIIFQASSQHEAQALTTLFFFKDQQVCIINMIIRSNENMHMFTAQLITVQPVCPLIKVRCNAINCITS